MPRKPLFLTLLASLFWGCSQVEKRDLVGKWRLQRIQKDSLLVFDSDFEVLRKQQIRLIEEELASQGGDESNFTTMLDSNHLAFMLGMTRQVHEHRIQQYLVLYPNHTFLSKGELTDASAVGMYFDNETGKWSFDEQKQKVVFVMKNGMAIQYLIELSSDTVLRLHSGVIAGVPASPADAFTSIPGVSYTFTK